MVLIIGDTTKFDDDWIPFEIQYAVDSCKIPIIAAYPDYEWILEPGDLRSLWPESLETRIDNKSARVIHMPFKKEPLRAAITRFSHNDLPKGGLSYWKAEVYEKWGIKR